MCIKISCGNGEVMETRELIAYLLIVLMLLALAGAAFRSRHVAKRDSHSKRIYIETTEP